MGKLKIIFVGDVSIENEFPIIGKDVSTLFKDADILSCNFEGPISEKNNFPIKKIGPVLSQNEGSIKFLKQNGFNFFNLANNHIMDFGKDALEITINQFKNDDYLGAGLEYEDTYKGRIIEINGFKIGLLSFAEWGFGALDEFRNSGYAWVNHPCVNNLISSMKKQVDFLIIQVHAGVENIEIPLPEWKRRYFEIIDLGADLIVGHHPHVPQGWEEYNGKYIFYSLGNFFMQKSNTYQDKSFVLSVSFDSENKIDFEVVPIIRTNSTVSLYKEESFMEYLNSLSRVIQSKDYIRKINDCSEKLWKERYMDFYASSTNSISKGVSFKRKLKSLKRIFTGKDMNQEMILHNIGIESHRYIVERYLKLNIKEHEEI